MTASRPTRQLIHQGVNILVHDYTDMSSTAYTLAIEKKTEELIASADTGLLIMFDARGATPDRKTLSTCAANAPWVKKYIRKLALLGVEMTYIPFMEQIIQLVGLNVRRFDDETNALDWLARPE